MADETHSIAERIGGDRWTPSVGAETTDFLENVVPQESRESVRDDAVSILAKGIPPTTASGQETGIVVGYVQSGKTMSFETVVALARDNTFQIVIIVAGISNLLLQQSTDRLSRDLRLDDLRERRWLRFQNPSNGHATLQAIRNVLDGWRDPGTPEEYTKTVLITVLKNHRRLQKLAQLIGDLDMQNVPVLIIDDEADQASLNTEVGQRKESTTYRRLMELKRAIPSHTYLQYTATPQAPLLVSIIDSLSPNFVQILEPGDTYVGGRDFFGDNLSYVRIIPSQEVPSQSNPLSEPPESLMEALRVFMVGVTAGLLTSRNTGNRSMLVHPSHRTDQHQEFYNWVRNIFEEWKRIFELPDADPDKLELIEEFREAYDELAETAGSDLPTFDELVPRLRLAFLHTRVLEVNARAGATPSVDWQSTYGWILVGGQAMDRGFTVEGLTVTYMPRGIGGGNADAVQQRARFFGYKRSYLGYCRLYLEQDALNALQSYVEHEEDIRGQLQAIQQENRPLNEWKRAFILDSRLQPCRHNVLEFDYMRGRFSDVWVTPRVVMEPDPVISANREAVEAFLNGKGFVDNDGHPERTDIQRHLVCAGVRLYDMLDQLLVRVRITDPSDSQRNTGLLLQLSHALENDPDELCTIYQMSRGNNRQRSIKKNGKITNLFQGKAPVQPREERGEVYPGDRAIYDRDTVTVQIHMLDLTQGSEVIKATVPVIAVWVPARLARDWVNQDQPTQGG